MAAVCVTVALAARHVFFAFRSSCLLPQVVILSKFRLANPLRSSGNILSGKT